MKHKCFCRDGEDEGFFEPSIDELMVTTTEQFQAPTTTEAASTTTRTPERQLRHEELINENLEVGIMFASKPIVQALANPFVGTMTNR